MVSRKLNRRPVRGGQTYRNSRKPVKSKVLDVRSKNSLRLFENLILSGPLTLVFARLEGCGPCERFKEEVWSPLTKMKNKGMNMAMIESEMIPNTSLANVPRKFYPTLMLVGPDKKAATFLDENGEPTNSMPRKNTLEEDKETLSALLQSPNTHPTVKNSVNLESDIMVNTESLKGVDTLTTEGSMVPMMPNTPGSQDQPEPEQEEQEEEQEEEVTRTIVNKPLRNELNRKIMNSKPPSPYDIELHPTMEPEVPSMLTSASKRRSNTAKRVPNVASDLLASQSSVSTGSAEVLSKEAQRGGKLLTAIREHTKSLEGVLRTRHVPKTRKNHK
jgi:hypothetical protein